MQKFKTTNEQNARIDLYLLCEDIERLVVLFDQTGDQSHLNSIRAKVEIYGSFWRTQKNNHSSDSFDGYRVKYSDSRNGELVLNGSLQVQSSQGMSYGLGEIPV